MDFPYSESAIEVCEKHLVATNSKSTEIENYLVRFLLVQICAEFEKTVLALIIERAARSGDQQLTRLIDSLKKRLFSSLRTGEMAGILGRLDENLKNQFNNAVNNSDAQVAFNNIVSNRHDFAHFRSVVQMSFNDLLKDYARSKKVLEEFANVLGVKPS